MENICERCQTPHNCSYGSGRFCSSKCAHGFSTASKRQEINEKVSAKRRKPRLQKICIECNESFLAKRDNQICCNRKCASNRCHKRSTEKARLKRIQLGGVGRGKYVHKPNSILDLSGRTIVKLL
jgi:hypothetical protein